TSYGKRSSSASAGAGSSTLSITELASGLSVGTTYHYRIVATNAGGTAIGSDVTFTTSSARVPSVPTGVSAKAGDGSATVSWKAPTSTGGARITKYTATASDGG